MPTCALLKLFYACDEPCELEIHHGKSSTHVLLPATASRWDKCSFRLPILLEGSDRNIKLSRISGGICAIEKIQLVKSGLARGHRYAAKNATLRGGAELAQKRSGAWDVVGAGEEADIVFDKIIAERAGWYVLAITYCAGENRDISIEVNETQRIDTYLHSTAGWFFPTWENAEDKEVLVYLQQGATRSAYSMTGANYLASEAFR